MADWSSFKYKDENGKTQTVKIDDYYGSNMNQRGISTTVNGVKITYNAYGQKGNDAKVAYLVNYYLHHGSFGSIPATTNALNSALDILKNIANDQLGIPDASEYELSQLFSNPGASKYADVFKNARSNQAVNTDNADTSTNKDAENIAFDSYYNDIYSRNENTLGREIYDAMVQAEENAGRNAIDLANAQAQQAGMAQAATVKSITDSLKAERMARLRAGMSESQIASQDMQTMIANTNALNEQIAASNLAAMQGQQQINDAQTTAYQNWLNNMNQTATAGSAFAAADAGSAMQLAKQYANATGVTLQKAYQIVTGQQNTGGNK